MKDDFRTDFSGNPDDEREKWLDDLEKGRTENGSAPVPPADNGANPGSIPQYNFDLFTPKSKREEPEDEWDYTLPEVGTRPGGGVVPPRRQYPGNTPEDDFVIGRGFNAADETGDIRKSTGGAFDTRAMDKPSGAGAAGASAVHGKQMKRRHQRWGCLSVFVWLFVLLVISIGLAAFSITSVNDMLGINKSGTVQVEIDKNMDLSQIAQRLKANDVIEHPMIFELYVKLTHKDSGYSSGMFDIDKASGYSGVIQALQASGQAPTIVTVRIPEGSNIQQIEKLLVDNKVCSDAAFQTALQYDNYSYSFIDPNPPASLYYRYEGYLFPDTYQFYQDSSDNAGINAFNKMMLNLAQKLPADADTKASALGLNIQQVMTMASIVQLECNGYDEDMPNVAAVFYNRLHWTDQAPLLGSTATTFYYGGTAYDTTKTPGLPPGPLDSPGLSAIEAALNPTPDFKYYYFCTDKDHKFYYRQTLDEFNTLVANLKSQGLWAS